MNSDFSDDSSSSLAEKFDRATNYLQHLVSELDQNALLAFYGLYKQATVGRCNTSKPGIFNMQARTKWNAWNDLQDMSKESAMQAYVDKLNGIKREWDGEGDDEGTVGSGESKKTFWASVSTPVFFDDADVIEDANKTLIDYVKDENIDIVRGILQGQKSINVNDRDTDGLCAIHWAADRGNAGILELLLRHGANVDELDAESGQTALHYAAACGHSECVEILLKHNADRSILDNDSASCLDLAIESNEEKIVTLLRS